MRTLQRLLTVGLVLVLALAVTGCPKKKKDPPPEEPQGNPLRPDPAGGAPANNDAQRGGQRLVNQNLMQGIGRYYQLCRDEKGKPPQTLEELKAYIQSDPDGRLVAQALDKGWVVLVLDPPPSANQVLAYEKDVYQKWNNRLVLFGDCNSVRMMEDAEFQKVLKGQ
jgi:hypothetical protein